MKLIQISHISLTKRSEPSVSFTLSGTIRLNQAAVKILNPKALLSQDDYYLHFYEDQEGDEKFLYCSFDTNPKEGIRIRFDGTKTRSEASNIVASAKLIIKHFTTLFDWPLAEDKKKFIRYQVDLIANNSEGIFRLY